MDAHRFATLIRALSSTPSRRSVVALLAGSVFSGLPGLRTVSGAPKRGGKGKGKRKKKKRGDEPTGASPPPAPPGPVSTYQCPGPRENTFALSSASTTRAVQVFTASQSGALREIQFQITKSNASTGDYLVELLVAAGDVPTNTVLAARSIANSDVLVGETTVKANFNGPPLEAGTQYAAAISRPGGSQLFIAFRQGNDCTGLPFTQNPSGSVGFTEFTADHPGYVTSVTVLP